jgi:hypothetical protein
MLIAFSPSVLACGPGTIFRCTEVHMQHAVCKDSVRNA